MNNECLFVLVVGLLVCVGRLIVKVESTAPWSGDLSGKDSVLFIDRMRFAFKFDSLLYFLSDLDCSMIWNEGKLTSKVVTETA